MPLGRRYRREADPVSEADHASVSTGESLCPNLSENYQHDDHKASARASELISSVLLKKLRPLCSSRRLVFAVFVGAFAVFAATTLFFDIMFIQYGPQRKNISQMRGDKEVQKFQDRFSVVINTYKRPEALLNTVQHYAETCGKKYGVESIFIVWEDHSTNPPAPSSFFTDNADKSSDNLPGITIVRMPKNSLNNRFLPIEGLKTDGVFMIDDDITVDCRYLPIASEAWRANSHALVGFYPRLAGGDESGRVYEMWLRIFFKGRFSFVLTKACFLHRKYLDLYSGPTHPQSVRDYVDEHFNCEDIAMAMLVANSTKWNSRDLPVYVEGKVHDRGMFGGISTKGGHFKKRCNCLTDLARIYEKNGWRVPLVEVSLQQQSWVKHYPGFWWQIRPSNFAEWFSY